MTIRLPSIQPADTEYLQFTPVTLWTFIALGSIRNNGKTHIVISLQSTGLFINDSVSYILLLEEGGVGVEYAQTTTLQIIWQLFSTGWVKDCIRRWGAGETGRSLVLWQNERKSYKKKTGLKTQLVKYTVL